MLTFHNFILIKIKLTINFSEKLILTENKAKNFSLRKKKLKRNSFSLFFLNKKCNKNFSTSALSQHILCGCNFYFISSNKKN
jgi:hypothetical protein